MPRALKNIIPDFWHHKEFRRGPHQHLYNFRRMWKLAVMITAGVAIVPLVLLSFLNYHMTKREMDSEIRQRMSWRLLSALTPLSSFFEERRRILEYIVHDHTISQLKEPARLEQILSNLRMNFGGFADLGVIDAGGNLVAYVGAEALYDNAAPVRKDLEDVLAKGTHISEVYLGPQGRPHITLWAKRELMGGGHFVLRSAIEMVEASSTIVLDDAASESDLFIVNHEGRLQTPSRHHGQVLAKTNIAIPEYDRKPRVIEIRTSSEEVYMLAYADIPGTPFILMLTQPRANVAGEWSKLQTSLVWFSGSSAVLILVVILAVATYLVNNMHAADQRRLSMLHQVEYTNKMATIGRLGSSIAHEINNPLAIIMEKAGFIKDLFSASECHGQDPKLIGLLDSIGEATNRCAEITRRLLRITETRQSVIEQANLREIIEELLRLYANEARYRSIEIIFEAPDGIPPVKADVGGLRQVFLNLLNNAFKAVKDGGKLDIRLQSHWKGGLRMTMTDRGRVIPESDLQHLFEPFFPLHDSEGTLGLGLSITYGIVQELGGTIHVESSEEEGTSFIVTLPRELQGKVNVKIPDNDRSRQKLLQRGEQEERAPRGAGNGVESDDG